MAVFNLAAQDLFVPHTCHRLLANDFLSHHSGTIVWTKEKSIFLKLGAVL